MRSIPKQVIVEIDNPFIVLTIFGNNTSGLIAMLKLRVIGTALVAHRQYIVLRTYVKFQRSWVGSGL